MLTILVMFWQWLALLKEKAGCESPRGTKSFSVWTLHVAHSPNAHIWWTAEVTLN